MKIWVLLTLLLALGTFFANGQANRSDGLVLTGAITGLTVVSECVGAEGRILVDVELYMQYRNDADVPLIVFKPDDNLWPDLFRGELGQTRLVFLQNFPSKTDKMTETVRTAHTSAENCYRSNYNYQRYSANDPLTSLIKRIDLPAPASFFTVIEPGSYYQFRDVITLETGYEIDVKVGQRLKEVRPRSQYPAFRVEYHLSVKKHQKGEGLLKNLQERWKTLGHLVLDSEGDFTVTSEPIVSRSSE